jgi:plastocyanin
MTSLKTSAIACIAGSALLVLVACGGDDTASNPDSGSSGSLNGCTDSSYQDMTASGATITWDFTVSPKCVKIKTGQTVTWNGDLGTHPLNPFGGDPGSPVPSTSTGNSAKGTFPTAGVFGFHCANHSSMLGAIKVVQ